MKLHTKQKGVIGHWEVCAELAKLGLPVFVELSDLSKTDIITVYRHKPIKLQVKAISTKKGAVYLKSSKSGPNGYSRKYTEKDVDIFAVYCLNEDTVLYIPASRVCTGAGITVRIRHTKNKQCKLINHAADYNDLTRVLRDYTQDFQ